jgi:MATE family multidrug resistance protein
MSSQLPHSPRFGSEVRATATLALPLVLGHVSTGLIGFVDNVIAGHHSTQTLAAVTIGTALLWLPMMVPIGTLISLTASVSQLNGAGRRDEIDFAATGLQELLGDVRFSVRFPAPVQAALL